MRALLITSPGTIGLHDVPVPARGDECLVRVRMAGICGTDLQILEGYAEFGGVPGHEFVGVVEAAPEADAAWVGKRVVGEINVGCRRCDWCRRGEKEHCVNRTVLGIRDRGGAFAEYVSLPAVNLHAIPDGIDDPTAVFVEPVAAACRIFDQMTIAPGARVAVIGDGRMGLLVGQVLRTATPEVTVFGRHEAKLAVARTLGLMVRSTADVVPRRERFDVVVDVTGRPEGLKRALEVVRPRGTVVMKSTFHGEAPMESWPIVVEEITLLGSRCGPFAPAISLLAAGAVTVAPLVSSVRPLEEHAAAFAEAKRALKVLFTLDRP
jgi:threonine dehydrogenase-like Zn-dependent dehydrogenase